METTPSFHFCNGIYSKHYIPSTHLAAVESKALLKVCH